MARKYLHSKLATDALPAVLQAAIPFSERPRPEGITPERFDWELARQLEQMDTFAPGVRLGLLDILGKASGRYAQAMHEEQPPLVLELKILPPQSDEDRHLLATLSPRPVALFPEDVEDSSSSCEYAPLSDDRLALESR